MITLKIYVKNSKRLSKNTDSLMYEIKTKLKTSMKILVAIKKCLISIIICLSRNTVIIQTN